MLIPANSPPLTLYQTPAGWLNSGSNGSKNSKSSLEVTGGGTRLLSCMAALGAEVAFGSAVPWRLRVLPLPSCPGHEGVTSLNFNNSRRSSSSRGQTLVGYLLPAVVALGLEPGKQLFSSRADLVRVGTASVPLWRGDVAGRSLAVVTDPRCCHRLT